MRTLAGVLTIGVLAGCASTTDVVPTGPDTFMVSSRGVMGNSSAGQEKAKAFARANDYCASQGRQMAPINVSENPGGFGRIASGDVEFRCIPR